MSLLCLKQRLGLKRFKRGLKSYRSCTTQRFDTPLLQSSVFISCDRCEDKIHIYTLEDR